MNDYPNLSNLDLLALMVAEVEMMGHHLEQRERLTDVRCSEGIIDENLEADLKAAVAALREFAPSKWPALVYEQRKRRR